MTFYDLFAAQCAQIGKKPREVAKEAGVKTSTLSMWKTKGVTPKYGTIRQLAAILNTEWTELVPEEQQEQVIIDQVRQAWQPKTQFPDAGTSNIELELEDKLLSAFSSLNEEGQQKAVERVEELTEIPKYQRTDDK